MFWGAVEYFQPPINECHQSAESLEQLKQFYQPQTVNTRGCCGSHSASHSTELLPAPSALGSLLHKCLNYKELSDLKKIVKTKPSSICDQNQTPGA